MDSPVRALYAITVVPEVAKAFPSKTLTTLDAVVWTFQSTSAFSGPGPALVAALPSVPPPWGQSYCIMSP